MCGRRIVTIDGPSGGGKSTVSRALAARLTASEPQPCPEETALTLEGAAAQAEEAAADAQSSLLSASAVPVAGLVGNSAAAMTDASHDPTLDALNTLPGVRMALEIGAQAQAAAVQAAHALEVAHFETRVATLQGQLDRMVEQLAEVKSLLPRQQQ